MRSTLRFNDRRAWTQLIIKRQLGDLQTETISTQKRSKGGKRKDLGDLYVRSSWEANFIRWLNFIGEPWEYEPCEFRFPLDRGTRSYIPDLYLTRRKIYVEIKGYMDAKSKTKLRRMALYYPNVPIELITGVFFSDIEQKRLCRVIPGWECKHNV